MSDLPHLIPENSSANPPHQTHDFSPSCPFCMISTTYGPISPISAPIHASLDSRKLDPPAFVLFSSEHVIAFLDIMPLTRGHVLVAPRKHRVKVGSLSADESAEIGRVLPMLARSVIKAVMPDIPHEEADYNVVQNNGPGAAQVVPHVHFHIVPRPPLNYVPPPSTSSNTRKYPPNAQPPAPLRTTILFGRGMRDDLDYEDAAVLVEDMREAVREEWMGRISTEVDVRDGEESVAPGTNGGGKRKGAWKV
ncbi:uncharacterized protein Z518_05846 [Rhinocladiella mackenziei CBS 650.93]|uniref:HIT domain-containing protein n=1 Tax=Rhinocladiella mackenziei CBS 650.93 TaxID=1442369 RepID=A0A0D2IGV1_9EURO|nr:uncharacterized protein Z518_05846 [Rhinocladiella mackenziei CBS 650.93]KIX04974.1 hypothetical protein Z518_05846 [Rhinocladiella mackenziei CBS 650.93]